MSSKQPLNDGSPLIPSNNRLNCEEKKLKSKNQKRFISIVLRFEIFFFASLLWLCTVATIHMKHIMTCKAGFLLFDSNKYAYKVSSMHLVLNNLLQFHTFPFHSANAVRAFPPFISSEPLGCRELLIRFFRRWCHRRILDLRVNECICLWLVHNLSYARVFNRFFFFPIAVFQSAKAIQNGLNIVPAVVNLMRLPWHKSTTKTGFVSLVLFDE